MDNGRPHIKTWCDEVISLNLLWFHNCSLLQIILVLCYYSYEILQLLCGCESFLQYQDIQLYRDILAKDISNNASPNTTVEYINYTPANLNLLLQSMNLIGYGKTAH